jgi:signal transduction histidine kinase
LRIVVQPHFWERKTFQTSALFASLAAVIFIVRRIAHHRLRRKLDTLRQQQRIEQERARIARDLHDDLGASLTEISLTSDFAQSASVPDHEVREHLRTIGGRARELVHGMDEIIWAVNPRNDSITSLAGFACRYAQQLFKPAGIACRFDLQPDMPEAQMNSEQRYNFFLAFKETLNNIARHAHATEMRLAIYAEKGKLFFKITDNGCGFELGGQMAEADGLGNIRERIEKIGGQCEIDSQPGLGTQVCLSAPLVAPATSETSGSNP